MNIRLPDGTLKPFDKPVSVADIAASIGSGLAKAASSICAAGRTFHRPDA